MNVVRIATRRSLLATTQANLVADLLRARHPGTAISLVEVETTGDDDRMSPVAQLTEVGAFVRAVQQVVLDDRADLAVHSCKDLPVAGPERLGRVYPARGAPWDVLCGSSLDGLPEGARVGTGSPRRRSQLRALRPDLVIEDIRGNVDTRLRAVDEGRFDAVVLAEAGLQRLGRLDAIHHRFTLDEMVPAPAQAALAVEFVAGGPLAVAAAALSDADTTGVIETERQLLAVTGAGCRSALGALATMDGDSITMTGFVDDAGGPRRATASGPTPDAVVGSLRTALAL